MLNYLLGMGYSALVFAIFNASVNPLCRERCGICSKLVYKHQQIVVCSDNNQPILFCFIFNTFYSIMYSFIHQTDLG